MKKLFISLLLAATCGISAQSVKYGLTGNAHLSAIDNVHTASEKKFGAGVGIFATIPLYPNDVFKSQYMFFQPQVEFSTQGENAKDPNYGDQKYSYSYISAAAYFKYFFHSATVRNNFFVFAGPKVEFLVSDKKESTPAYDLAYKATSLDNNVNSVGFGVSGGVGYNVAEQWEVFARYDQGLTKVYTDNPKNTYNVMLAVGLNYTFKGKPVADPAQ